MKNIHRGTSLVVRWLELCAPNAGGAGSIPGRGTKIPHAAGSKQTNKKINLKKFTGNISEAFLPQ